MRKLAIVTVLLLLIAPVYAETTKTEEVADALPIWSPYILRVTCLFDNGMMSAGTGFVTDQGVFTAFHVVDGQEAERISTFVSTWDHHHHKVEKITRVYLEDIVRMEVPTLTLKGGFVIADDGVTVRKNCYVLGYWGRSIDFGCQVKGSGTIFPHLDVNEFYDFYGTTYYFTTVMVGSGCSGGPLFVEGKVVGVLTGSGGGYSTFSRLDKKHLRARAMVEEAEASAAQPTEPDPKPELSSACRIYSVLPIRRRAW